MKKQYLLGSLKFLSSLAGVTLFINPASAAILLQVDLSVDNTITITSTTEASLETVSGGVFTGVYLDGFYGPSPITASPGATLISGDLTTFLNPSNNSPALFRLGGDDPGLNIFAFSSDGTVDFVAGTQAFTGEATWTLTPESYAAMLNGSTSGDLYFPADDVSDLGSATLIGEWVVNSESISVPESSNLMGLMVVGSTLVVSVAFKRKRHS